MERAFRPLSLLMPPPRRSAERIVHCAAHRPERDYPSLHVVAALRGRLARRPAPIYLVFRNSRETTKWPGQLRPSLRSASASRSTGTCRPNSDPGPFASVLNGSTHRPRARLGGGRRLSSMEL